MMSEQKLSALCGRFAFEGSFVSGTPYGSGHINGTFLIRCKLPDGTERRYILQQLNTSIFKKPEQVMENVVGVTAFLRQKIIRSGGDPMRETMTLIPVKDGSSCFCDEQHAVWRAYAFIENAAAYDRAETPEDFYETGVAFGRFQKLLSDYPAQTLHETIPDFHCTPMRFQSFMKAVEEDRCGRAKGVQREIEFIKAREADTHLLTDLSAAGKLPLRVTHNDTKLNNIMIDNETKRAICVIDLDTVMPGLAVNDFGDSIRFGASSAEEDERDLSKVWLDLGLYELYTKGFLEGVDGSLTDAELDALPAGAKLMTLECGMRFLTDYLEGDTYFKIRREGQNLDRARTQLKLVADMEAKWNEMKAIVDKYRFYR